MSLVPLSNSQERVERSIFERIRLELVDKGYTPDINLYNTNVPADQVAWDAALSVIAASPLGFSIELYGAGSYEKNDDKKVPRIVIDAGNFLEGELGGDQTRQFQLADDLLSFDSFIRPPQTSELYINIHLVAATTKQLRTLQAILSLALQVRGYLPLYDILPNVILPVGNFFYRKTGFGDLPNMDEGVLEKVYKYTVYDIYESEDIPQPSAALISEIQLDIDPQGQVVLNLGPACAPVEFYINSFFIENIPSGTVKNMPVKDTLGNEVGSYIGLEWIVPTAGTPSLNFYVNGFLFYTAVSVDQDLPVLNSALTPIGSNIGLNWIISDTIMPIYEFPDLVTPVALVTIVAGVIPNFTIDG